MELPSVKNTTLMRTYIECEDFCKCKYPIAHRTLCSWDQRHKRYCSSHLCRHSWYCCFCNSFMLLAVLFIFGLILLCTRGRVGSSSIDFTWLWSALESFCTWSQSPKKWLCWRPKRHITSETSIAVCILFLLKNPVIETQMFPGLFVLQVDGTTTPYDF